MKKGLIAFIVILLCIAYAAYDFWLRPINLAKASAQSATPAVIFVHKGMHISKIAVILSERKIINHPHVFIIWARLLGVASKIKTGEFALKPGMTSADILNNILQGKVVAHNITFVEGMRFNQMRSQLYATKVIKHPCAELNSMEVMQKISGKAEFPEGLMFPSTYRYYWGDSDCDVFQHAYKKMQQIIDEQWQKRASGLWYKNPYQALIVASMIESEARLDNERPIIASVILNRLRKGMRLQIDATLKYGLNKPLGYRLTKGDLMQKTPYNTYRFSGLPPTPIDMPGLSSIMAALHPAQTTYLFYVSKNDGSHVFSETYKKHNDAVQKYQR